jgi:hypothetical protein
MEAWMRDGYLARRKSGYGWIISLPPEVRRHLKVTEPVYLHWHLARRGEAVLTVASQRRAGRPDVTRVTKKLAEAERQIDVLRRRGESRDRAMYAEGYHHGYTQAAERLVQPHGPSAERGRRRRLYAWAFPRVADAPVHAGVVTVGDVSKVGVPEESPSPSGPPPAEDRPGGADASGA